MAQSVKRLTLGLSSGHDPMVLWVRALRQSPMLTAQSLLRILSLSAPSPLALSLSLSK